MKILLFLLSFLLTISAYTETFNFAWNPPTLDANGNPLQELTGYKLYVSKTPGLYTDVKATIAAPSTSCTFSETLIGKYYAVVTSYNSSGESTYSNEITFDVRPVKPAAPGGLRITP